MMFGVVPVSVAVPPMLAAGDSGFHSRSSGAQVCAISISKASLSSAAASKSRSSARASVDFSCCSTAWAMGSIMAVVAELLIHMDRKDETIMKPNINLCVGGGGGGVGSECEDWIASELGHIYSQGWTDANQHQNLESDALVKVPVLDGDGHQQAADEQHPSRHHSPGRADKEPPGGEERSTMTLTRDGRSGRTKTASAYDSEAQATINKRQMIALVTDV
ncbi:hypothetical protein EYF80_023340 [Liparis tanakae]|uniref:Uncharacterized protein n=1 Tax=Liparis tanakae TaxID=230148 RepID=A0A4Z2HNT0_9TELE|nr:hypothetical protein EYF80_023340 [Liparis tanakae]